MADGKLVEGDDYLVERWTDDSRDASGHLIWFPGAPSDEDMHRVRMVTVDRNPDGEPDYRNLAVNPDRPLDPRGARDSDYGPEPYDLDDLVSGWDIISP